MPQPVPKPPPRRKPRKGDPWRNSTIPARSANPGKRDRQRRRQEVKADIKAEHETCIWPGCRRRKVEAAHGYPVGSHPEQHDDPLNLWWLCPKHHRTGLLNCTYTPELARVLRDLTDERRLLVANKRALPIERIHARFWEAFGEILRRAEGPTRVRYARYLRVKIPESLTA